MPDANAGQPTRMQAVAANVKRLRIARGWTQEDMADRLYDAGRPVVRQAYSKVETGHRAVSIDELAALGNLFGVDPWSLTSPPTCADCADAPPSGFACLACGRNMPVAPDAIADEVRRVARPQRRRVLSPELLGSVAAAYREAYADGKPPTQAVADRFDISHRTAGRWVSEARRAGNLGPADGTRAGEVRADTEVGGNG